MKRLVFLIALLAAIVPDIAKSQATVDSIQGIRFEQGLSWEQVIAKAKSQRKYVFVDCYTTWCGPCKKMDKDVYSIKKVGDFFNEKFISIKFQMDTSKNDNQVIKALYPDAHYISDHYKVSFFPTFLFFTSDGNILNRGGGLMDADDFIKLADDVSNHKKNYYTLLQNYKQGKRDLAEMSYLSLTALHLLADTSKSQEIAKQYILLLKKHDLLTKENIVFMREFTRNTRDKGFSVFYRNVDSINKVMSDDTYAQSIIQNLIYNEIIKPVIEKVNKTENQPHWNELASILEKKYNVYYSRRVITVAKLNWYGKHKNWLEYTKYLTIYVEKYVISSNNSSPWTAFAINNSAWTIFQHSKNIYELNKALSWSNRAVMMSPQPNWMDTYANILYKLGRYELAIMWEEVASKLDPNDAEIEANIRKMKKREPTWPLQ